MTWICLSLIALAFVLACPGTWMMRAVGRKLGQVDQPGTRKIHAQAVPATGGVAMVATLMLPMATGLAAAWMISDTTWTQWHPGLAEHLPGLRSRTGDAVILLICMLGLHIVGLIDDRKNLGPMIKLGAQCLAAAAPIFFLDVRLLELWGAPISIAVTFFWFLTITNAFNFLDNMDGLSAGVGAIASAIFLTAALITGQWFVAALLALLLGALLGFLVFNLNPASIFMGDGGSLVLGYLMAFCSIRVTYYDPTLGSGWWAVLTPLVVLAVPLYDITSVTCIRLAQGKSPFVGDTQHFSHRLVRRGLTRRAAVAVVWACTLATGLGGVMLPRLAGWQAALIATQTFAVILVLVLLERTPFPKPDDAS